MNTVDLSVTGNIVPGSCNLNFVGGGLVNYGVIKAQDLSNDYTLLPEKELSFTFACAQPTIVGFSLVTQRPDTMVLKDTSSSESNGFGVPPIPLLEPVSNNIGTGIGLDASGNKLGGIGFRIKNNASNLDGQFDVTKLYSNIGGDQYSHFGENDLINNATGDVYFFGLSSSGNQPVIFNRLTGILEMQAYLNKMDELDLDQSFVLNGLVTFMLFYP
ncbi:DUF1120 domain-containing protein [Acinetobacter courvalinii]|nr:DUF1120 domain-containing protein [Acinetobacter courvalinii]